MDNIMAFPDSNTIKDEASLWVVKLHGQTYKTDQGLPEDMAAELRSWLAQSDLHRDTFLRMLSGWEAMSVLEELADILPLADAPQTENPPQPRPAKPGWLYGGLAMAASVMLLTLVLILAPPPDTYTTDIGEQANITLDDGSVLHLNTNSEVFIDYSENRRAITLRRGEAHFDVAKNKQRPFVVYAGDGMVWAVGTAFNVNYRKSAVDVIVSEGKVKVYSGLDHLPTTPQLNADVSHNPSGQDVLLLAGEGANYQQKTVTKQQLPKQQLEKALAWQSGALLFEGETLEQAIREISHYTSQQLVIIDPAIRQTRVGGRFKTDDINQLLASLAKSLNIKIEKGEGSQLLFSKITEPNRSEASQNN